MKWYAKDSSNYKHMVWKSGKGKSVQIHIEPESMTIQDPFAWRISSGNYCQYGWTVLYIRWLYKITGANERKPTAVVPQTETVATGAVGTLQTLYFQWWLGDRLYLYSVGNRLSETQWQCYFVENDAAIGGVDWQQRGCHAPRPSAPLPELWRDVHARLGLVERCTDTGRGDLPAATPAATPQPATPDNQQKHSGLLIQHRPHYKTRERRQRLSRVRYLIKLKMSTNNSKKKTNSSSGSNSKVLNEKKIFEIFLSVGLDQITDKLCNTIWRGQELTEFDQEILDSVANVISADQLESLLSRLKDISSNVGLAQIITVDTSVNKQLPVNKKQSAKNNSAKSKKKSETKKKTKNKKKLTNQKRGRNTDDMDLDSDSEEEEDEDEEDEEEEKEDEEKEGEEEEDKEKEEDVDIEFNKKCNVEEEEMEQQSNEFSDFIQQSMISVKSLCILMYWMIERESRGKEIQFLASSVYLYMVVLSRRMFHPSAYRSVLKLLRAKPAVNKKSDIFSQSSQQSQADDDNNTDMAMDSNDENENPNQLSSQRTTGKSLKKGGKQQQQQQQDAANEEISKHLPSVIELLDDLQWILERFSLDSFVETYEYTVEVVASLSRSINFRRPKTKSKTGQKKGSQNSVTGDESKLVKSAFQVLNTLISGRHGVVSRVLPPVLKELVSMLTLTTIQGSLPVTVPKQLYVDRDNSIAFINQLLESNPSTQESILVLLQHICVRVPEKADYRSGTVESITQIISSLPDTQRFIQFLITFSKNTKSNFRLFSVEVALCLLQKPELMLENIDNGVFIPKLLSILVQRSSDKVSTVRSKALSCLALLLQDDKTIDTLKPYLKAAFGMDAEASEGDQSSLMKFLAKRADDEKSGVRKSAIQVLEVLCMQQEDTSQCNRMIIGVLSKRIHDTSPLIRKQVIQSMTRLFIHFRTDLELADSWITSVLPLVADRESTVADKSLESMITMIFDSITAGSGKEKDDSKASSSSLTAQILDRIVKLEMTAYLHKCCILMSQKKLITPQLIKALQSLIKSSALEMKTGLIGSWTLLSKIGYCCPDKLDQQLILSTWEKYCDEINNDSAPDQIIQLVSNILILIEQISPHLSEKQANEIYTDIMYRVKQFTYHPQHVNLFIAILLQTTVRINRDQSKQQIEKAIDLWTRDILNTCDEGMSGYVFGNGNSKSSSSSVDENESNNTTATASGNNKIISKEEELIGQYLFVIGEIIQIPQVTVPSRIKTMVQALIAPTKANINNMSLTTDGGQSAISSQDQAIPQSVRAHAFITLGKLCLGDDRLAKKCIATFAKELEISDSPVIRNNVMIVMCDLCIRYTQLVDNYIPNIARCLRDKSELVRRQTLILLTRLLQEDYVKWKGSLFYRFVESLVDPSPTVSQFAHFCLMNVLQVKYGTAQQSKATAKDQASQQEVSSSKNIFYSHFLDTIFVLNECTAHPNYNKEANNHLVFSIGNGTGGNTSNSKDEFTLKGDEGRKKRMAIYTIFLQNIGDEHRFQLVSKLAHEVLAEVADEKIPLSACANVVYDVLSILACKEIKLQTLSRGGAGAADVDEDVSAAEAAVSAAQTKLLTNIVKKNVIEFIVPVVIQLKHLFEKKRSSLIRELMVYLKELYKDYKTEMNDIMSADRQLAKEIEYDLKTFNKKSVQSPSRLSIGGVMTPSKLSLTPGKSISMTPGKNMSTPGKADLTNFVVPQLKTPKSRQSIGGGVAPTTGSTPSGAANTSHTPKRHSLGGQTPNKPFATPIGKLSLSSALTPLKMTTSAPQNPIPMMNLSSALSSPSSHSDTTTATSNNVTNTGVKSALRLSVSSKSSNSSTPYKNLRFSLPGRLNNNNGDDDHDDDDNSDDESNVIKLNLSLDPQESKKQQQKQWNVNIESTENNDDADEDYLDDSDDQEEEEDDDTKDGLSPPKKVTKTTKSSNIKSTVNKKHKTTHKAEAEEEEEAETEAVVEQPINNKKKSNNSSKEKQEPVVDTTDKADSPIKKKGRPAKKHKQ
ncbi:non-SMC condensin II complex [Heterostelium album PN500]|uniref:Non-SMC condensin II complex n=1 Tax=Heterostelium pallidum (strain ATCC 26659 / Pp 5 / PN500) TaxID=670386 RepID=D3BMT7_HETP5|nr:non-SMC condensin II complex [Heterostelium album PN500]EFA77299.1 non-SMC condensin II complex [Heterostelium album PN500]|eukprot:XP_020429428.1 non-SMC condensin II complex [Heterostelium album PN500]